MVIHIIALLTLATVARTTLAQNPPATQCATPPVQCCTTLAPADNPTVAMVLKGLGIVPEDPKKFAGLSCADIQGTLGPGGNATWYVASSNRKPTLNEIP